ncbi:MAG: 4Fe-4S binding protein [Bacteroidota bacterium]|nr:4Fe-4S binding protein [Bacteroidota bacterium]
MKKIRIVVSLILFTLITFYFLDFAGILSNRFHVIAQLQFIPALVALNVSAVMFIFLITFFFGRIYCSSICPLGILQDISNWLAKRFHRKKKYPHFKEQRILRWSIVALTTATFIFGIHILLNFLDPYSAFGRIATNIFKPAYLAINNIAAAVGNHFNNFRFYKVNIFIASISSLAIASLTFIIIIFLSYKYGRLYCNTICPVGTILGFIARFSLFKIKIDREHCNSCGLCEMKCKSSCIDAKNKEIDYSRCVTCFDCLEECKRSSVSYNFFNVPEKKPATVNLSDNEYNTARRTFIFASMLLGLTAIQKVFGRRRRGKDSADNIKEIFTSHNVAFKKNHPITPPGSVDVKRFNDSCTACQLCVSKCPSQVLQPTFTAYGIIGIMQPAMSFKHGYCNYHCTLCSEICPTKAIAKISRKEKKTLQIGKVKFIKENCVVVTDGTNCGACSEHCPTQAVSMQPYKGDLNIPTINNELCVGCGGCEYICPVRPYRAIYVEGNPVHLQAKVTEEKETKKIKVDDFGF